MPKRKIDIPGVLLNLYGIDGMDRDDCPLSDAELERLSKEPGFTKSKRWLELEYRLIQKIELGNGSKFRG